MNQDRLLGFGRQLAGTLKQRWGRLRNDPDAVAAGAHDLLAGRIQEQRGAAKERSDRELAEFLRRNRNWRQLPGR